MEYLKKLEYFWALPKLTETLLVIALFLLARLALGKISYRTFKDTKSRFRFVKVSSFVLNAFLVLALFQLWVSHNWSTASFVGLLSAGLAFVFREPLLNLAGWCYIVIRQPFSLGDRVQIDDGVAGDVVDIGLTDFTLMEIRNWVDADQSTGRIISVPNGVLWTKNLANYHVGFPYLWHEMSVTITYESNWEEAVEIYEKLLLSHESIDREDRERTLSELKRRHDYLISFTHLTPIIYVSNALYGIELTGRYLCEPRRRRSTESQIFRELLKKFTQHPDISFAYPTYHVKDASSLKALEKLVGSSKME